MPGYKKISGTHPQIIDAMQLADNFYAPITQNKYAEQLEKDCSRSSFIATKTTADELKYKLFDPNHYEQIQAFGQGDFAAGFGVDFFSKFIVAEVEKDAIAPRTVKQISFSYINDDGVPCGLCITRIGAKTSNPPPNNKPQYAICHVQNTQTTPENRKVTYFCDEKLFDLTSYDAQSTSMNEENISSEDILSSLKDIIGSKEISALLTGLFNKGRISHAQFNQLDARIQGNKNLDDRDFKIPLFERWLTEANTIDPKLARDTAEQSKQDINFFKDSSFEELLSNLITRATEKEPQDLQQAKRCLTLYLEYKIQRIYSSSKQEALLKKESAQKLWNTVHQHGNIIPVLIDEKAFIKQSKALYQQCYFNQKISKLKDDIYYCPHAYIYKEATILCSMLEQINVADYDRADQTTLMDFMQAIDNFVSKPNEKTYEKILAYYHKFNFQLPNRDQLLQSPEQAYMNHILDQPIPEPYCFDLQGRILCEVKDHRNKTITVSHDINQDPDKMAEYYSVIKTALVSQKATNTDQIMALVKKIPDKNVLLPLQQRIFVHLTQLTDQYQSILQDAKLTDQERATVLADTQRDINNILMKTFAKALIKTSQSITDWDRAELNIAAINGELETATAALLGHAEDILLKNIQIIRQDKKPRDKVDLHVLAPNPILSLNQTLGLATWIDARQTNPDLTHKRIKTYPLTQMGIQESKDPIHIQTSSFMLNIKDSKENFDAKFRKNMTFLEYFYNLKESYTYHLFTGLKGSDDKTIKQTIETVHHHNRDCLSYNKKYFNQTQRPLCHLQIIGITEQDQPLGYRLFDWSGYTNEATLMAEIALLSHLDNDQLNLKPYQDFLQPPQSLVSRAYRALFKSPFFAHTSEGKQTINEIQKVKDIWQRNKNTPMATTCDSLSRQGLQKLMAFDLHFSPAYGLLVQTLSLQSAPQAILSDHPRHNLAAITLSHAQYFNQQPPNKKLLAALQALAKATTKDAAIKAADTLNTTLAQLCPTPALSAPALIPIVDAGTETAQGIKKIPRATAAIHKAKHPPVAEASQSPHKIPTARPGADSKFFQPSPEPRTVSLTKPTLRPNRQK